MAHSSLSWEGRKPIGCAVLKQYSLCQSEETSARSTQSQTLSQKTKRICLTDLLGKYVYQSILKFQDLRQYEDLGQTGGGIFKHLEDEEICPRCLCKLKDQPWSPQ